MRQCYCYQLNFITVTELPWQLPTASKAHAEFCMHLLTATLSFLGAGELKTKSVNDKEKKKLALGATLWLSEMYLIALSLFQPLTVDAC